MNTSDSGTIVAGSNYLATVTTLYNGTLTDSMDVPTVSIFDPNSNSIVTNAALTRIATGTYTYSYTSSGSAPAGTWESVFSANVASGNVLPGADYWTLVTTPAQVKINSITSNTVPSVSANVTITDEGLSGNEYQYEWCVVSNLSDPCGSPTNIFDEVRAKYINAGEDFNTILPANVPNPGNYYFKLIVYFGTQNSVSSVNFTAVPATSGNNGNGGNGGGGGGGGGSAAPPPSQAPSTSSKVCGKRGDFNCDGNVNAIDFSILLYFWGSKPPFSNPYVDLNKDGKIDATDFSILLYYWGK